MKLTNPDARKKLSAEQIILKKKESEELVSELVKHDFIIPDKITLSRFNLDDNPYAFTQLLRQGARLDKDVLGRLLPSLYQDLKFLPKDDFSALYKEAFDLSVQEFGWQKINEHVKRDLFGSFGYLNLNAKMLAYCLGIEWFINDIRCALTSIECGALCEIESSETTVLQEMYELAPEQFVSAYGFNASDLIAHLEQCNQKNSPQSSWQERTAEISTPPAGCEVDSLISLFQPDKPRLQQAESLEERIQLILDNYYSAPGPSKARALMLSKSDNIRDRLRSLHDCDHAVRTALFTQAFAQLLKAQDATSKAYFEKNTELEELLVLAEAYHDVVAEDEPKDQEEIQAAFYLLRDLKGLYPDELLVEVAVALANKNVSHSSGDLEQSRKRILDKVPGFLLDQVDPELREALKARFFVPDSSSSSDFQKWLRMVIRFGDTVDIARCFGEQGFKWELLPLPDGWSSNADAMKQVRQLVSSCWNLAALTGGAPRDNAYAEANGLRNPQNNYGKPLEHNELVRRDISARENVWTAIRQELDRMAKRTLATKAGIHTATSEDAPLSTSSTYFRIFDERDLDQIELPEGLTELDTLQISSGDLEQLNPGLQKQLKDSINKLRLSGIRHPLGTVSQETLGSKDAVTELSKRGFRVWNDERVFDGVPVTVKRLRLDSAADATQSE